MLLVILVCVGISIYSLIKGYYIAAVFGLMGISKGFGFIGLGIASLYLFYKGEWIAGAVPILLILWNIFGTKYISKHGA